MINIDKVFERLDAESYLKAIYEFSAVAVTKDFVVQDIGVSSRVFSHWAEMGLIDVPESDKRVKRLFNLTELIWLKLVHRLREFGYPIEKIRILKELLITPFDFGYLIKNLTKAEKQRFLKKIDKAFLRDDIEVQKLKKTVEKELECVKENDPALMNCYMFMVITEFLLYRRDVRFLIDLNAACIIDTGDIDHNNTETDMPLIEFDTDSYLNISMVSLLKSIVTDERKIKFIKGNRLLNENELHILSLLREGKAKSITIKFKNQKPHFIEVTQERKVYAEARLSEVMLGKGYQDITIKTENGTIAVTNITTRKKLDD
ncbi:MAG: helix-turn-helix domain-containing protein [Bacteroidetes bacterium]|nr:helix-turn-helix domain-containing protein [Bacteroidota bacterium]